MPKIGVVLTMEMLWRGVRERLPLHDYGMSTEEWMKIPPQVVRIPDMWLTQSGIYFEGITHGTSMSGDPVPHAVRLAGELELHDGHHRVFRALLAGERHIAVRVLELDS